MVNITEGISRKKHDENMTAAGEGVSAVDKVFDMFFASLFCRKLQNKNVGCCKTVL